jgi:hypothetical protein
VSEVAVSVRPLQPAPAEAAPPRAAATRPAGTASPFVPLQLGLLALLLFFAFQTWQLVAERGLLAATHTAQQQAVDNAGRLRASLDALAADTQRMADAGNPNAALLVAELKKRGVTINPNAAPAAPAAAASR